MGEPPRVRLGAGFPPEGPISQKDDLNDPNEPIPWMQQLLDSPFILLFLGVLIPMLVYNLWGVVEIMMLPLGK